MVANNPAAKDEDDGYHYTPSGPGAMEAGLVLDEEGGRFVLLTVREPKGEPTLVTFTVPVFQHYVEHLIRTAKASNDEANWGIPG